MGRLKCFLLLAATATLVKADDGWKRLLELNTAQESRSAQWARSSNGAGGNRVPFVPEDIAMPPPWLLPNQQPQVAFPVAQAQVRSFFDEEVVDWPPRSPKLASGRSQHPPEPSSRQQPPPPPIHTTLQPPRRQWTDSPIRPVQHVWLDGDRQQSTSQRPQTTTKKATSIKLRDLAAPVTQQVVDLIKLPAPVEPEEPYQTAPANEPKPEQNRRQNKQQQQPTANRKTFMSSYDSSEYDYDDVSSSGHQEKRIINAKSDHHDELDSRDQSFYDESPSLTEVDATMSVGGGQENFYAQTAPPPQRRQQTVVQPFQAPESRRQPPQLQPTSVEEADVEQHQAFDYSKTIFRTPGNSGQNGRQQQQQQHAFPALHEPAQQRENLGRPSTYGDEPLETERQQQQQLPAKAKQGQQQQTGVRRPAQQQQQRQQQQPSERNSSPAEMAVFEAERPSFHSPNLQASPPNQQQRQFEVGQQHHHQRQQVPAQQQQQQQQQVGDWPPPRHPAGDLNRKNKPRINPAHHPEEQQQQQSTDNFGNVPRYKPKNPAVQPVQPQQYQEEREDPDLQPPYHHQPPPYRPEEIGLNYDQPEEPERPQEHHRPKEHHKPIYDYQDGQQSHGPKNQRIRRPPPTESRPAPEFDPAPQSNPWQQHNTKQQPEENAYDPYGQQPNADPYREPELHPVQPYEQEAAQEPHHQPQEHQTEGPLPLAPAPGRRPSSGRPSFQSGERFNGAAQHDEKENNNNNDGDFDSPGPFKAPPPQRPHHPQSNNRQRPHRPPPTHQRPKDASLVTQGLNTLKTLVGLQTSQQQRQQRPHHSFNRPGGPRRRPPQQGNNFDNNGGEIGRQDQDVSEEFGSSDLNNFPVQARHNVQPTIDEPMEHRGIPDDDIQDIVPPSVSTTETIPPPTRVTALSTRPSTRPPTEAPELPVAVSSTAAPEETKSTLFPPFNKRVRPQPPSPAQTENKANAGKDSPAGQLRITSYKQRIEAMKERAKLREQLAQSKKDTEGTVEQAPEPVSPVSVSSTSTTTVRPSTTRPKIPPRMPVRRPVTAGPPSSTSTTATTESVPLMEKMDKVPESRESSNYDQYKRRFKPKPSFSRPSPKEEEPAASPSEEVASAKVADVREEEDPSSSRKNLFGKMPGSPFVRRRIQQKQQREEEERLLSEESSKGPAAIKKESVDKEEMPAVPAGPALRPNKRIRPGQFARTTTAAPIIEPSLDDEEEPASSVLASPEQWPPTSEPHTPVKPEISSGLTAAEEEEESPKIELVSIAPAPPANEESDNHQPQQHQPAEEPEEFPTHQQPPPFAYESSGQPYLDKPDVSSERMGTEEEQPEPIQVQEKPRHSFFTMATNDPILPIEELLNIRVRDNGKDM